MLNELNHFSASAVMPTGMGGFGIMIRHFGFENYGENIFGLAYGRKLMDKIGIRIQFDYFSSQDPGYQSSSAIGIEASVLFQLTEKLFTGLHIANPPWGRLNKNMGKGLSQVYSSGLGYEVSEKFFVGIEFEKTEDQPFDIHAGIIYRFLPLLSAKIGVNSATSSFCTGFGIAWRKILLELNFRYHPQLGPTPGIVFYFFQSARKSSE